MGTPRDTPRRAAQDELAPRPVDARELRALHLDLVGRPPLAAERDTWREATRPALVAHLLATTACWRHWLDQQLYYFLLVDNFRPESEAMLDLPRELALGRVDVVTAIHRIVLSPNFNQRNPGADTFVTVVMEQLLGIEVQRATRELEIGKRLYDGSRGLFLGEYGSSQADVVSLAMRDERFLPVFLEREHDRFLRAAPRGRELRGWTERLEQDPYAFRDLLEEWLLSEAWDARLDAPREMPNRTFVRTLFVDLFDRVPERDEIRRLGAALDGLGDAAPLRSTLARILIDSGEVEVPPVADGGPEAWVRAQFQRFLHRAPTAVELETFAAALRDPAGRPETALYALLSDASYATF